MKVAAKVAATPWSPSPDFPLLRGTASAPSLRCSSADLIDVADAHRSPRCRAQPFCWPARPGCRPPAPTGATRRRPPPAHARAPGPRARVAPARCPRRPAGSRPDPRKPRAAPVTEERLGYTYLGPELVAEIGRCDRPHRGGRRTGAAVSAQRCRRIRSTSARISARSASMRSSERSSSTTAARYGIGGYPRPARRDCPRARPGVTQAPSPMSRREPGAAR